MDNLEKEFSSLKPAAFLGYTQCALVLIDSSGTLLEWNPAFDKIIARNQAARSIQELLSNSSRQHFEIMLSAKEIRQTHLEFLLGPKREENNCLLVPVSNGRFLFCAEFSHISWDDELVKARLELEESRRNHALKQIELESLLAQVDEISYTDALTFLPNRKRVLIDLQLEIMRSDRYHKPLTILIADIDNFLSINSNLGHTAGDQVLTQVACELLTCIRQIDRLGRIGGDEFLFVLPSTNKTNSLVVANRAIEKIRALQVKLAGADSPAVRISIGIAQYRIGRESREDLLNRADLAMQKAKKSGGDRSEVFLTGIKASTKS
jgi:diguanylate cyclase (GGDEF)-like protein